MAWRRLYLRILWSLGLLAVIHNADRVVVVADLHGDYEQAVKILAAADLIDSETMAWKGGNATLVQTGDIVDRGDNAKQIYELFFRLADEAPIDGGSVINLMGNHEVMNIDNDRRYVTPADYKEYGSATKRVKAWSVDGWLGKKVRRFSAVAKVKDALLVHAGLLPQFLADGRSLDDVNRDMLESVKSSPHSRSEASKVLLGKDGPLWTRHFDDAETVEMCATAEEALRLAGAKQMIVGHSIQESADGYRVRSACGGRIILADTAISRAYGGEMSYIEINSQRQMFAVYPDLGKRHLLPFEENSFIL